LVRVSVHIRLAGPLQVTADRGARFVAADFPGRQGRLVFAALASTGRPVDRNELADILWPNRLPASWTRDLSAVVSKLRALLAGTAEIVTGKGRWYALELPANTVVDIDVAARAIERAEDARPRGDGDGALDEAGTAAAILAEPFLAGDECAWVDERRAELRDTLVRALTLRAEVLRERCSPVAIAAAQAVVDLEPEHEQAHLLLMRAQIALGDRVEALRGYERLRRMLAEDFGLFPSPAADELMHTALGPDDSVAVVTPALPLPTAVIDARRTRIVGRDVELGRLDSLGVADTRARLAAVLGPAGIGKSRLACEVATRAHAQGCIVLYGACSAGPATPYQVVIDAFASIRLLPDVDRRFTRLADSVVHRLAAEDVPGANVEERRADVLASVATAVGQFAGNHVLLLILDDAHWADNASIRMLEQLLAVVTPLRVVVTARTEEMEGAGVGAMLARLRTKDGAVVLELGGLTPNDVGAALRDHGAETLEPALVQAVHRATGGNPLYVREIGRHLAVAGRPAPRPDESLLDAIGLPHGLAELIDANVARLGVNARRVLEACSVIGGSIELGVLARACGLPEHDLLTAVDVVRCAGVLVEASTDGVVLRFDHPLVREVLLQSLGGARRAQLHQRVAEAIEAYHHDDVDRYSAELAHHLAAAANVGSARDAIEFAIRAGDRANAVCAYDEAAHWFSHALRLARGRGDDPDLTARLLTALGDAQNHAGDARAAQAILLDAVSAARAAQNADRFAVAVLHLGGVLVDEGFEGGAVDERLVSLLGESIAQLPESSPLRARCSVRLAEELHFAGDRERCLALCAEAEATTRAANDPDALAAVLGARHYALYGAPAVHERLELLTEIQTLRTGARPDSRWARDYFELGDMNAFEAAAAHFDRQISTSSIASDRYYPAVWRATCHALRGELDVAETAANDAVEIGRAAARGPAAVAGVWAAQIFSVRLFDGRLAELRDFVDASAEASPSRPIWRAAAAFMHLELGNRAQAELHFHRLRAVGLARLPETLDRPMALALLSWVAAEIGSVADARELRRQLRPYQDFLIVVGAAGPYACAGPAAYPLALLEARLGRTDAAKVLLEQADAQAAQVGARLWLTRIRDAQRRLVSAHARTGVTSVR
jgi:DNA-binding SARP family transcriptional activator